MSILSSVEAVFDNFDQWIFNHNWAKGGFVPENRVTPNLAKYFPPGEALRSEHPYAIQQARSEIYAFVAELFKRDKTKKIIEIGAGVAGGTGKLWELIFQNVLTIDADPVRVNRYIDEQQPSADHEFLVGYSHESWIQHQLQYSRDIDVLFIDGDHSHDGVKQDYSLYYKHVNPGGLVVFHDTCINGDSDHQVRSFTDELEAGGMKLHHIRKSKCLGISYLVVGE